MNKIREFIKSSIGIDASKLSEDDAKKLAKFVLRAFSLETPIIAKHEANRLGLSLEA